MGSKGKKKDPHLEIQAIPGYPQSPYPHFGPQFLKGKREKEKPHILLLFLLIFYRRDHRNQSLLPRPTHLGFAGGTYQPLVFYFFKKPSPEQPRIPLLWGLAALWWPFGGNCSRPGSRDQITTPTPFQPGIQHLSQGLEARPHPVVP